MISNVNCSPSRPRCLHSMPCLSITQNQTYLYLYILHSISHPTLHVLSLSPILMALVLKINARESTINPLIELTNNTNQLLVEVSLVNI